MTPRPFAALLLGGLCSCAEPAPDTGESSTTSTSISTSTTDPPDGSSSSTDGEDGTEATGEPPLPEPDWLSVWGASPTEANPISAPAFALEDQSLRQIAHVSLGGEHVRVRLSNTFGADDVPVTEARLALALSSDAVDIDPTSDRQLTVDGAATFSIPAGEIVVTDPVELELPPRSDLSVSLYFAQAVMTTTVHPEAQQTAWLTPGNFTATSSWPEQDTSTRISWYWLNGVEVIAAPEAAAIVALGDSLTDGAGSTRDANRRWPDHLAERLQANDATAQVAVVNAGIGSNCLLRDFIGPRALDRFDRDVLDQPGVAWVIVLEGINDIGLSSTFGQSLTAEQLIAGYTELIERAHARGLRVYGGTLLPYEGADYYSEGGEAIRLAVNEWIREGGSYDAILDFDAVIHDPMTPARILPAYDAGDHLHLNDAGYAAMANAIELALFE